jgi:hypothetical protein
MPENRDLIQIIITRLAREGMERLPAVGGIIAAYMQTLDDIDAAIREEQINRTLEELRQQLRDVTTLIELLEHPKTLESLEALETSEQLLINGESAELREIVANFIAYLKDPSKAYLDHELKEAIEIERHGTVERYGSVDATLLSRKSVEELLENITGEDEAW